MSESGIQHKQTFPASPGYGFDDAGERVPTVTMSDACADEQGCGGAEDGFAKTDLQRALLRLVELLTADATPLQTGQRMHLMAYFLGVSGCKTQAELARELNVSPGRVSQISKELPGEFARLSLLKSRAAKGGGLGKGPPVTGRQ